jgi:hypothetical protein
MGDDHGSASAAGRRILVISNETVEGAVLHEAIRFRAHNVEGEVLVVAPALNSRARHWMSETDDTRAAARRRLDRSVERLAAAGVRAHVVVDVAGRREYLEPRPEERVRFSPTLTAS